MWTFPEVAEWEDDELLTSEMLEPTTLRLWQKAAGRRLLHIDARLTQINGRVSKLERFVWMLSGGLVVVSTIVVPLFLKEFGG